MTGEQSAQSGSGTGSTKSSDSIINGSMMSGVPINKEGCSNVSELVDRMLAYQPPSHLTAEMGEAVDEVIKYMKTIAELLSFGHS